MTLWLVGMMGSGKTSAGRLAADRLGVPFLDIDDQLAVASGTSMPELWGELGEQGFRRLERAEIEKLAGTEAIVSTGGGAVLDRANRQQMKDTGTVVWLKAEPAVLAGRLGTGNGRPLLDDHPDREARLTGLLDERSRAYGDAADYEIDTSTLSVEEVSKRIEGLWRP